MTFDSIRLSSIKDINVLREQVRRNRKLLAQAETQTTVFRGAFFITVGMLLWALHQNGLLPFLP